MNENALNRLTALLVSPSQTNMLRSLPLWQQWGMIVLAGPAIHRVVQFWLKTGVLRARALEPSFPSLKREFRVFGLRFRHLFYCE